MSDSCRAGSAGDRSGSRPGTTDSGSAGSAGDRSGSRPGITDPAAASRSCEDVPQGAADPAARAGPDRGIAPVPESGQEPRWWNPANALTLLRVALVPVIVVLLLIGDEVARWWAFGIFCFAALTDSIDGWVARRLVGVTRWGQLADPAADKALIVGSLAILAYLGRLPWWAVVVIVLREVGVTAQRTLLLRRGHVMPASVFGKAKTISQILAVTLYLLPGAPGDLRVGALWVAVAITVLSGVEYAFRGQRIVRAAGGGSDRAG